MKRTASRAAVHLPAFALAVSTIVPPTQAADGIPVCDVVKDQTGPRLAVASDNATWVVWRDSRRSDSNVFTDIYAARLPVVIPSPHAGPEIAPGAPARLLADGFVVAASGRAEFPFIVPSDSGDVLVVWGDSRSPGAGIYAQRMRADGSIYPGWPAVGRLVTNEVRGLDIAVCSDGAGGAYLTRRPRPVSMELQHASTTRITKDATFAPGWTETGVLIAGDNVVEAMSNSTDPSGGCIHTVRTHFNGMVGNIQVTRVGRVSPTGVLSPNKVLPSWYSHSMWPSVISAIAVADGSGGFFAAWDDTPAPGFYGQHWDAAGATTWPDSLSAPFMDALVPDGSGGVYVVGRPKTDGPRLAVLRRDAAGAPAPLWDPAGVTVAEPFMLGNVAAYRNANGMLVFWSENRGGVSGWDIRAMELRPNGRPGLGWIPGGSPLCDVPGNQSEVVVHPGSPWVVWTDDRNFATSGYDIYTTYLDGYPGVVGVPSPNVAPGLRLAALFPNPARHEIRVALEALAPGLPLSVELLDVRGRVVLRRGVSHDGAAATALLSTRGLAAGVYVVRAVQGAATAHARVAVLP